MQNNELFIIKPSLKQYYGRTVTNVFQKVYDEIKYLLKSVTSGSDAEKQLLKAKKIFEDVYRDTKNNTSEKTQLSLEDIANMNEKSYNHHGWAKVNDVLSDTELADFQSKVGERKRLDGEWLYNLGKGKQMYAVGVDGVNNTLVISDGNYENPSIEKVYHIGLNNETDIEVLRDEIYKREKDSERTLSSDVITNLFADEPIGAYRIEDFFDYQTMREEYEGTKGKRNTRNSQNVQNRGRSNPKTQYSVNDTKTPNDGVFFDEKTQFSVSDNKGRTLTKEQQEKFKDSVVRDKEGNLIPLYHGTTSTDVFTEFKHENGVWLSSDYDYAKEYSGWWNRNFFSEGEGLGKDVYADNNLRIYEMYADIKNGKIEFNTDYSYDIKLNVADSFGYNYEERTLHATFLTFDMTEDGRNMSFGESAHDEEDEVLRLRFKTVDIAPKERLLYNGQPFEDYIKSIISTLL